MSIISLLEIINIIFINKHIKQKTSKKYTEIIITCNNINQDKKAHIDYLITYLLPLLSFDINNINIFNLSYINILIIINAISENYNFNLLLYCKKYRIYTGTTKSRKTKTLLIKKNDYTNIESYQKNLQFVSFGKSNDIYINKSIF